MSLFLIIDSHITQDLGKKPLAVVQCNVDFLWVLFIEMQGNVLFFTIPCSFENLTWLKLIQRFLSNTL